MATMDIVGTSGMGKAMEQGDLHGNLYALPENGENKEITSGDLGRVERRGDDRKEEENVLQNMHQLQEVGEDTFADEIRLGV